METNNMVSRMRLLTGASAMGQLARTRVNVFGVGGVGSWCAEALVRSGITRLMLVDYDRICITNVNRQVQATAKTIGRVKVEELASRLREINPAAEIIARQETYRRDGGTAFGLDRCDYVIDAIDSLSAKVDLIMSATAAGATVYTSLGAACRLDPTRIRVDSLWNSQGCHLGRLVRKRLRRRQFSGNPLCVYSEELPLPPVTNGDQDATVFGPDHCDTEYGDEIEGSPPATRQVNGSAVHVTGTFGFFLAGLVIQDVLRKENARSSDSTP